MPYKLIRDLSNPATAEDVVRVQQNVQAAFQELAAAPSTTAKATPPMYRATGAELVIFVDQVGGKVTVVLPQKPEHPVTLRSVSQSTNAVTINAAGRDPGGTAPLIDGKPTRALAPLETVRVAFDGAAWWTV